MKCTHCAKNLTAGYIQSASTIFWSETKHLLFFNGIQDSDVTIAKGVWTSAVTEAFYCDNCNTIVIQLKKKHRRDKY